MGVVEMRFCIEGVGGRDFEKFDLRVWNSVHARYGTPTFALGGGGWVGFSHIQNDLSQTPHMDTESVD